MADRSGRPGVPDRRRLDRWVLLGLVILAAVLRLVDLASRGTWDADQGHDLLVLRDLVEHGTIPLLGPPTSLGDVHHGALYYYLLAPAAFVFGADPVAVTGWIAAWGVGAVAVTWWLARAIGGSMAGAIAGLVVAVSASAIDESTFVWNPNLIPLASALAFAGAWQARATGRPRWWLVSAIGTGITLQCHVLGIALLPAMAAFFVADWRASTGPARLRLGRFGLTGLAIVALTFLPLVVHELTHDFGESRHAIAYLVGERAGGIGLVTRVFVIGLRSVAWPLTGLVTDAPIVALLATGLVVLLAVWRARAGSPAERQAVGWLGLTIVWSVLFLVFLAPDLATVVPGLPNDHYHAFLDPAVAVLAGLGVAGLASWRPGLRQGLRRAGALEPAGAGALEPSRAGALEPGAVASRVAALVFLVALVAWNVSRWPPATAPDGGWPAAEAAADRIGGVVDGRPFALLGRPAIKSADAYGFPLARLGLEPVDQASAAVLVVACDRLFEGSYGQPCGGPAEEAVRPARFPQLVERFDASARTVVSIYSIASVPDR